MNRILLFITLLALILAPTGVLAQASPSVSPSSVTAPTTFKEGGNFIWNIAKQVPQGMQGIWYDTVLPFWSSLWQNAVSFFNQYILGWLKGIWQAIVNFVMNQIHQKQPQIHQELQKEKQQTQQSIQQQTSKATQSMWDRFMSLFQSNNASN